MLTWMDTDDGMMVLIGVEEYWIENNWNYMNEFKKFVELVV